MLTCSECNTAKPTHAFFAAERGKSPGDQRCQKCVKGSFKCLGCNASFCTSALSMEQKKKSRRERRCQNCTRLPSPTHSV
jgi:hypothetical protein